jgi:membrane fusion protein, multidrug efflux system
VDPRTGTLQVRSIFPNEDGLLLPNQFVRVLVRGVSLQDVFVIPQSAVSQGPPGAFVYVVNSTDDGVTSRPIKLDREVAGGAWAVKEGLHDGERIVVEGLLRIRPGASIKPVAASADGPAPGRSAANVNAGTSGLVK